ncbi:uncharacterized protein LOC111022677 isoform X2 [Momordica charantia]|uniref:Uncharacterized protein LOC111022677 isoform X2 n=1 Tax=Momordica charantia TaxID=3673 RepID=A0A6J1DMS8_MOMCH|nr:uncharacterized protein LOC111022677 isoform X2 [Momordica charantia]
MRSQLPSPEQLNPSIEKTRSQLRVREKTSGSSSSKKRAKKSYPSVIRRSERIQNVVQPYQNRDIEPVVEEIAVSDSEKEDEPLAQGEKELDEPTSCEQNLHGKIDYVVKLLETQGRAIKNLLSESLSPTEVRYKSLYIESQKKKWYLIDSCQVQTLMDENQQLTQKLETALCKVEAYEKGNQNFSEVLEKLKDVMLVSNLTKVTETAVNASSQAIREAMSSGMGRKAKTSAAKGKKRTKTK